MTSLTNGLHNFNIRFKDNADLWSSVLSHFFYKAPTSQSNPTPEIVAYEYWIDNDYGNAVIVNTPVQQQVNINELIAMSSLNNGLHNFNIRFKDNADLWSSVASQFFYKTPQQIITQNVITAYRYWMDNDFNNAISVSLSTPIQQFNLIDNLDLTQVPKGNHEISFQFKDSLGMWSSVLVDSMQKISLPIADFSFSSVHNCDSTTISFTNNSIDGDTFFWDFGDGSNSTLKNPSHSYFLPNTYQVSLTVTDTLLSIDSSFSINILIDSLNTISSISETVCDSFTAPDGLIYTTSGMKTAIIPNVTGCDSVISINLSILNSTSSTIVETACDSFTAPDGLIYTTSGMKTAIIPNAAGCDSVISINLSILNSTSSTIAETACDSFTAPDGLIYTTSGMKTAIIPNAAGCDSVISINLSILNSTSSTIAETACDSFTAPDGLIYTTSGMKTAIIPNAAGCDSTININLTILNSTSNSITDTACFSYTAPDGQDYTTSGIKTAIIPNAAGCDSVITINLTINTVDTSVTQNGITLTANAVAASYQWLDCNDGYSEINGETNQSFTPSQNGSYAVEVIQSNCVDTSICFDISNVGILGSTFNHDIVVFPNPTNGLITVDLGKVLDEFTVSLEDMSGRKIMQSYFKDTQRFELNLNVSSGVYVLTINSGKDKAMIKLIKK